tara:strand:- start:215825 stop:217792 length:1968 start_codon:yes stop_codon:yes gene_type:complete
MFSLLSQTVAWVSDTYSDLYYRSSGLYKGRTDEQAFYHASVNGDLDAMRYFAKKVDVTQARSSGQWPLLDTVAMGKTDAVLLLIELGVQTDCINSQNQTAIHIAAKHGYTKIITCLIAQGVNATALDNKSHTALYYAAKNGRLDSTHYLISIGRRNHQRNMGQDLSAKGNLILYRSVITGDSALVDTLLTYPEVSSAAEKNENLALKYALRYDHVSIVESLLRVDSVRTKALLESEDSRLALQAQNNESSMTKLSSGEEGVLSAVKKAYQHKFDEYGLGAVLQNFREYLESQYELNPARSRAGILPHGYNTDLESQEPYYKNIYHSAWRFVFGRPNNPWMSEDALFVRRYQDGRKCAVIPQKAMIDIAYLWLAASDKTFRPLPGFTHESIKALFTRQIALIGRSHNWDDGIDNLQGDKPSCPGGLAKRLIQSVQGHPLLELPESRNLTVSILKRFFTENIVAQNPKSLQTVSKKLSCLSYTQLKMLSSALDNKYILLSSLTREQEAALRYLTPSRETIESFKQRCFIRFGYKRILWPQTRQLDFHGSKFVDYKSLILYFSNNMGACFYGEIKTILKRLIEAKRLHRERADTDGKSLFYSIEPSQHASSSSAVYTVNNDFEASKTTRGRKRDISEKVASDILSGSTQVSASKRQRR